jgi:hypothetical protein
MGKFDAAVGHGICKVTMQRIGDHGSNGTAATTDVGKDGRRCRCTRSQRTQHKRRRADEEKMKRKSTAEMMLSGDFWW